MVLSEKFLGTVKVIGNTSGGSLYQYKAWTEGKLIRKLTVWAKEDRITGIKFWKTGETDDKGTLYGKENGTSRNCSFQNEELITSMTLWLGKWNTLGDRAGRISFTTSMGQTFEHGTAAGGQTPIDVYSGLLVGAEVRAGDDVNCWGFAFLRPLRSCQLRNVTYTNLSGLGTIQLEDLDSYDNDTVGTWRFEGQKSKTISSSWSKTEGITTTLGFSVSAGVPGIFEVEEKIEWQQSESYTVQQSTEVKTSVTWSVNGILEKGETIGLKAYIYSGTINVPYQGTMVVTVDTGDTLSFPQTGTYMGVSMTSVKIPIASSVLNIGNVDMNFSK